MSAWPETKPTDKSPWQPLKALKAAMKHAVHAQNIFVIIGGSFFK